jgi:hypothetical protein
VYIQLPELRFRRDKSHSNSPKRKRQVFKSNKESSCPQQTIATRLSTNNLFILMSLKHFLLLEISNLNGQLIFSSWKGTEELLVMAILLRTLQNRISTRTFLSSESYHSLSFKSAPGKILSREREIPGNLHSLQYTNYRKNPLFCFFNPHRNFASLPKEGGILITNYSRIIFNDLLISAHFQVQMI